MYDFLVQFRLTDLVQDIGYVGLIRMPLLKRTLLGYPFDIKRFI